MALLVDERRPCGVTFAFTERTGGVSEGPYASLNLDDREDDAQLVAQNRAIAFGALGIDQLLDRLVQPLQVHGERIVTIERGDEGELGRARAEAAEGADAVVCVAPDVPVMLLSADCALVVLVVEGGFAVAHSGWRGTMAEISAQALGELCRLTGARPDEALAYVGPHIGRADFEVSEELRDRFVERFGDEVAGPGCRVDLGHAIRASLVRAGMGEGQVAVFDESTMSHTDRFYSWRAQGGACGRNAAIACRVRARGEANL